MNNAFTAETLATPPALAQHGASCACRACASGSYQDLLSKSDYQRHEITRLTAELAATRRALALSDARRLTIEINRAIERGDQVTWARKVAERAALSITSDDLEQVQKEAA
jgi:hypothetical protein